MLRVANYSKMLQKTFVENCASQKNVQESINNILIYIKFVYYKLYFTLEKRIISSLLRNLIERFQTFFTYLILNRFISNNAFH